MIAMLLRRLRGRTAVPTVVVPEPDGRFYGGDQTLHASTTIDIVTVEGVVTEVWFRCTQLPFKVSTPKGCPAYAKYDGLPKLTGVQLSD